jgi:hypothetical protein
MDSMKGKPLRDPQQNYKFAKEEGGQEIIKLWANNSVA